MPLAASIGNPWLWAGFLAFVALMLALDLGVFNRRDHVIKAREAALWSAVWIALSVVFGAFLWYRSGAQHGQEFLVGYLIEKSLSVDNLFVFVAIFGALGIPREYQHRVLFWGVLTALVLRAVMIFAGVALLERFEWLLYVFGGFLIVAGVRLFRHRREHGDGEGGGVVKLARRLIPSTARYHGHDFTARENGKWVATPLLLALVAVELADVVFAVDSIPAVFAVTRDPFIVFTSNIFAILGLRSLYFLLADVVARFVHLRTGLAAILVYVGVKMLLVEVVKIPPLYSLGVILAILAASIWASVVTDRRAREEPV